MSDIPEGYYVNGKEMLDYRREPIVLFPGSPVKKKKRRRAKSALKKSNLNKRDGNICHYCSDVMKDNGVNDPMRMSVEHVVPRSLGGSNEMHNLVLAHRRCNEQRGSEYVKCYCPFCKEARRIHESQSII